MPAILQVAFILAWVWTLGPAQGSIRVLYWRTVSVLGYGWWASAHRPEIGLSMLTRVCDFLVVVHIVGLCMAVLDRDSRFFKHRIGGVQEA
jgi:hypothetical protein